ncbi:MAG TPA: methyltransferase domain-containing protein [Thermoanaerobaculia bacterium]|nr:methyltransferase domain-containing protein [Thermoanaerobaculia bacterium]
MLIPTRLDAPELLDEHDAPAADVARSLRDLRRINRWLGGIPIYRRLVKRFAPVDSLLDVGAGSADLLESAGVRLRIALDCKIDHLLHGRRSVPMVVGDAARLPFRSDAVDLVTSAHFFHHFTAAENESILRESLRVARKGVAVNDTRRHYAPLLFVRLLGALRLVGRITRSDAPASVLRGYTVPEVRPMAEVVGARRAVVRRMFPFRFAIMLWK